jgi:hypothetical protein
VEEANKKKLKRKARKKRYLSNQNQKIEQEIKLFVVVEKEFEVFLFLPN